MLLGRGRARALLGRRKGSLGPRLRSTRNLGSSDACPATERPQPDAAQGRARSHRARVERVCRVLLRHRSHPQHSATRQACVGTNDPSRIRTWPLPCHGTVGVTLNEDISRERGKGDLRHRTYRKYVPSIVGGCVRRKLRPAARIDATTEEASTSGNSCAATLSRKISTVSITCRTMGRRDANK